VSAYDIRVDSEPGEGTIFYIDLNLAVPKEVITHRKPVESARNTTANSNIRLLAVDDHPINLEILDGMLQPEGYQVTAVEAAAEALFMLDQAYQQGRPFTIALLDYQMPGMDGKDLVMRIRADSRFDDLRLIILTSIDQAISAMERRELNIHSSITKPLRRSRLFDAINETLGRPVGNAYPATATPVTDLAAQAIAEARSNSPGPSSDAQSPDFDGIGNYAKPVVTTTSRSLNVLVVEDNAVNQMVISELLQGFGHNTILAENGLQALETVEQGNIDLVLMDCQMPVMDGFEATQRIRSMEYERGLPRLPIIAVTSNAIKGDRERCLESGMDDYVSKPINTAKLVAAIEVHFP